MSLTHIKPYFLRQCGLHVSSLKYRAHRQARFKSNHQTKDAHQRPFWPKQTGGGDDVEPNLGPRQHMHPLVKQDGTVDNLES